KSRISAPAVTSEGSGMKVELRQWTCLQRRLAARPRLDVGLPARPIAQHLRRDSIDEGIELLIHRVLTQDVKARNAATFMAPPTGQPIQATEHGDGTHRVRPRFSGQVLEIRRVEQLREWAIGDTRKPSGRDRGRRGCEIRV